MVGLMLGLRHGVVLAFAIEALDRTRLNSPPDIRTVPGRAPCSGSCPMIGDAHASAEAEQVNRTTCASTTCSASSSTRSPSPPSAAGGAHEHHVLSPDTRSLDAGDAPTRSRARRHDGQPGRPMADAGSRVLLVDTDCAARVCTFFGVPNDTGVSRSLWASRRSRGHEADRGAQPGRAAERPGAARTPRICCTRTALPSCSPTVRSSSTGSCSTRRRSGGVRWRGPGGLADGVVLVARPRDDARRGDVRAAAARVGEGAGMVGVVVNTIDFSIPAYGYGAFYYGLLHGIGRRTATAPTRRRQLSLPVLAGDAIPAAERPTSVGRPPVATIRAAVLPIGGRSPAQ